jgi:hypothetical protein
MDDTIEANDLPPAHPPLGVETSKQTPRQEAIAPLHNTNIPNREAPQPATNSSGEADFRSRVTERYNWYLHHYGGLIGGRVAIYEVPNFDGDWTQVGPEDYFAYRLSVMGVRPEEEQSAVSPTQVAAELDRDKTLRMQRAASLLGVLRAYHGPGETPMEQNDFMYVSPGRMRELVSNAEFPAAGAFRYGPHVGVLLNAELEDGGHEFSAQVAHEVGHLERMRSGDDDTEKDVKKIRLEEGIVQANARDVASRGDFTDAKALEAYDFETSVAVRLADKLGVALMEFSHAEIEQLMRLSPTLSAIAENPYQLLVDSLDTYVRAVDEVDKAGDSIDPKRLNELAILFMKAEKTINTLLD